MYINTLHQKVICYGKQVSKEEITGMEYWTNTSGKYNASP